MALSSTGQQVAEQLRLEEAESRGDVIVVGRKGRVGVVLFDRPEVGNAYNDQMIDELERVWEEYRDDRARRVVVLGSTTERWFSTGIDVKAVDRRGQVRSDDRGTRPVRVSTREAGVWKPVIAAVEGRALGGGLQWITDADIVVASEQARFQDSHVELGFVGNKENLGVALKAGIGSALYLTLVGKQVQLDARRALELGLVQEVVPAGQALARSMELAELVSQNSPSAVAKSMEAIWGISRTPYLDAVAYGALLLENQWSHPDSKEGPAAFAQRRPPTWVD